MLSTLNSVITGALAMGNFGLEKAIYFQLILLGVFVVATLVGYKLISNVPTLLHTPLMSGMNALSGVTVLGALSASASLFKLGTAGIVLSAIFGSLAIALAMVNVVGGFMVTDRMLGMIAKKKAKGQTVIYAASAVAGAGLLAVICCMDVIAKGAGTSARDWVYLAMAIVLSLGVLLGIAMMGKSLTVKSAIVSARFACSLRLSLLSCTAMAQTTLRRYGRSISVLRSARLRVLSLQRKSK